MSTPLVRTTGQILRDLHRQPNHPAAERKPLTQRQQQVVDHIRAVVRERGHPPSQQEIADHFGVSKSSVSNMFTVLEQNGWLRRGQGRRRPYTVLEPENTLDGKA